MLTVACMAEQQNVGFFLTVSKKSLTFIQNLLHSKDELRRFYFTLYVSSQRRYYLSGRLASVRHHTLFPRVPGKEPQCLYRDLVF